MSTTGADEILPTKSVGIKHEPVVYVATTKYGGCFKIGTTVNLRSRLNRLNRKKDFEMYYVAVMPGDERVEREIHRGLIGSRINGGSEYFWATPKVIEFIERISTTESDSFIKFALEHR